MISRTIVFQKGQDFIKDSMFPQKIENNFICSSLIFLVSKALYISMAQAYIEIQIRKSDYQTRYRYIRDYLEYPFIKNSPYFSSSFVRSEGVFCYSTETTKEPLEYFLGMFIGKKTGNIYLSDSEESIICFNIKDFIKSSLDFDLSVLEIISRIQRFKLSFNMKEFYVSPFINHSFLNYLISLNDSFSEKNLSYLNTINLIKTLYDLSIRVRFIKILFAEITIILSHIDNTTMSSYLEELLNFTLDIKIPTTYYSDTIDSQTINFYSKHQYILQNLPKNNFRNHFLVSSSPTFSQSVYSYKKEDILLIFENIYAFLDTTDNNFSLEDRFIEVQSVYPSLCLHKPYLEDKFPELLEHFNRFNKLKPLNEGLLGFSMIDNLL